MSAGGLILRSRGPATTMALGRSIGAELLPGDVVALTGDLGAGKTCFTQGIAEGLGVPEESCVRSPSFVILNVYPGGRLPLYHFDLYRVEDPAEMEELGYREILFGEGVTVIEWAEKIRDLLPEEAVTVRLTWLGETEREIALDLPSGGRWRGLERSLRWTLTRSRPE